ncbi:MAG TPA: hypothetical protein VMH82_02365 [Myxococcota bacterium]|nr:hypothetical protein [Myxococcota bacterium]
MSLKHLLARASALLLALATAGCTDMVRVTETPSVAQNGLSIHRIAVAPFRTGPRAMPPETGSLVAGFTADALARRGLDVIPPTDVAQSLGLSDPNVQLPDAKAIVQAAAQRFGADTVAVGSVSRWQERTGQAAGTMQPASVALEVKLYATAAGALMWAGAFDETQVALGVNVLKASQYPGGGTRWLTAAEFARFGADQVVSRIPLAPLAGR